MTVTRHKTVAAFVALLIFMQAMIPAGFMPDLQALGKGMISVTICTGYGAQTILVDQDQNSAPGEHGHDGRLAKTKFCPFSFTPNFAAADAPSLTHRFIYEPARLFVFVDRGLSDRRAHPSARPRAPPLHLA